MANQPLKNVDSKINKMKIIPIVDIKVTIELNYEQAKALEAMAIYGASQFLEVFKEKLGKAYIEPYEQGIISLFEEIKGKDRPIQKAIKMTESHRKAIMELNNK